MNLQMEPINGASTTKKERMTHHMTSLIIINHRKREPIRRPRHSRSLPAIQQIPQRQPRKCLLPALLQPATPPLVSDPVANPVVRADNDGEGMSWGAVECVVDIRANIVREGAMPSSLRTAGRPRYAAIVLMCNGIRLGSKKLG